MVTFLMIVQIAILTVIAYLIRQHHLRRRDERTRKVLKKEMEKEALRSVIKQETKQLNTDLEDIKDNVQKTNVGTNALIKDDVDEN